MNKLMVITVLVVFNMLNISYAESWQLAEDKQGIKVYLKDTANSSYKTFKGQVIIKASARKIAEALEDANNACKWLFSCKEYKLISKQGREYWAYGQTKMPWPTSDRDVVLFSVVEEQANGTITVKMKAMPNKLPEVKGHVRVTKTDGLWQFTPIDTNTTKVTYQAAIDPGGTIPAWLANQYVVESPFETLKALKGYMETGKIEE